MTGTVEINYLHPIKAGVVYSPAGDNWLFYPEERLFVGLTGDAAAPTNVRTFLQFSPPDLDSEAILLMVCLCLHIIGTDPPDLPKLVCLREPPGDPPWTVAAEVNQPVLEEHRLAVETGVDLEFDLMSLAESWRRGMPNRGVLLDFGRPELGLVTMGNGLPGEPGPFLRFIHVRPRAGEAAVNLDVEPDTTRTSPEFPCGALLVKNIGPGTIWVTPLYRFARGRPLDPVGVPLGILSSGEYLIIEPQWPSRSLHVRLTTSIHGAEVLLIPLKAPERREGPA